MKTVSLWGVATHFPEKIVTNDFFAEGAAGRRGMFTAPTTRRHVGRDETAASMIAKAAERLIEDLALDAPRDVDVIFTNVTVPDQPFTGCGAEVARRLGLRPRWVVDLHNADCVSFIYMLELARALMTSTDARGALICNVQNAAGRVFAQSQVRLTSQAPVPGDGCGVGYVAPGDVSPLLSLVHRCQPELASDMSVAADDGRRYWEPGTSPSLVAFTDERVAAIIKHGNRVVPEMVAAACGAAGVSTRDIKLLITTQPSPIFLQNWREALELPREAHHDTFDTYGNLFGAALPVNVEDALAHGKLRDGDLLALAGFSHAGDYAAAALVRWQAGARRDAT